jgi:hypothetical protein
VEPKHEKKKGDLLPAVITNGMGQESLTVLSKYMGTAVHWRA